MERNSVMYIVGGTVDRGLNVTRGLGRVARIVARALGIARSTLWRSGHRLCPVCGRWADAFVSFGRPKRRDAQCPFCGALERHRLLWLYLRARLPDLDDGAGPVLHVAPAKCIMRNLRRQLSDRYLTGDLHDPKVDVTVDVTRISFPDDHLSMIICSHVLEHVADDRLALAEFRRTLRPGCSAIVLVPVTAATTYEDPAIVSAGARLAAFGQEDHVRRYGSDFPDRLRAAGFDVEVVSPRDLVGEAAVELMALPEAAGDIYVCTKPLPDHA